MAEELRGWKDIGAHFGTSERTAQRWEREHGMPVHRTGRTRGASVFALRQELDAWRLSPEGLRAESAKTEDGSLAAVAVVEHSEANAAPVSSWRSRKTAISIIAVIVVVVAVAWGVYSRRASRTAIPTSLSEAYTVPNSSAVFVLKVTTADGTPFTFHVLDGDMATLAVRGGRKLGFVPARTGGTVKLTVAELTSPDGNERLNELKTFYLAPEPRVHLDNRGTAVDIEWIDTVKATDLPAPPPDKRRGCCITRVRGPVPSDGDVTACAVQVSTYDSSCCGFGGCVDAKTR